MSIYNEINDPHFMQYLVFFPDYNYFYKICIRNTFGFQKLQKNPILKQCNLNEGKYVGFLF